MQKLGYPNISIKLFENYDAWLENRFLELAGTFTALTMRDGLYGKSEGRLQIYDTKNLHTLLDGDQLVQISVGNANESSTLTRIYATKHSSVSVDSKSDNMITFQLVPLHKNTDLKFSRTFFPNATETIQEMIKIIYMDYPLLAPMITGVNIHIPVVPWVLGISDYMDYIRDTGLSVGSDTFPFVWEDFYGIHLTDFAELKLAEPINLIVGEPRTIGQYASKLEYPLAFDFEWLTKSNSHNRNPFENSTIYTYSMLDKTCSRLVNGEGYNSIFVSRNGGYADQLYRNGYEEATRINTMAQYDSYAKCKIYGNFTFTPGTKLNFYDMKNQFLSEFYIDEVIHEVTNNTSITTLYMFSHSKKLTEIEHPKVKNELKTNSSIQEDSAE